MARLEAAAKVEGAMQSPGGIMKEAALLTAWNNRECSTALTIATDWLRLTVDGSSQQLNATGIELGAKIEGLAKLLAASETHLAQRIDAFTTATDASTKQLARWTKVMAWATIALAVFAIGQVVVAVIALFHTP
jgi:hypothetical protein